MVIRHVWARVCVCVRPCFPIYYKICSLCCFKHSYVMFAMPEILPERKREGGGAGQEGADFKSDSSWVEYDVAPSVCTYRRSSHTSAGLSGSHFQPTQSQQCNTVHPLLHSCISPLLQYSLSPSLLISSTVQSGKN